MLSDLALFWIDGHVLNENIVSQIDLEQADDVGDPKQSHVRDYIPVPIFSKQENQPL